ncbi:YqaJ viral recombinase [Sesbania bispinosa]|nr:YqaJ viral recombinase [Sesbania bispinosa]
MKFPNNKTGKGRLVLSRKTNSNYQTSAQAEENKRELLLSPHTTRPQAIPVCPCRSIRASAAVSSALSSPPLHCRLAPSAGRYLAAAAANIVSILDVETQACRIIERGIEVYSAKPEDNWLAASPDGVVDSLLYELPSRGVLEIKCPYFYGDMSKAFPWSRIPVHYIPQAQGLMEILGRDWMDFYVWTVNGSSLFRLHRDAEYWDIMKMALSDFWWKHVQPARELYSSTVITDPLFQLRSLIPAPKHELCSYIVYRSKHIVDNSKLLLRENYNVIQDLHVIQNYNVHNRIYGFTKSRCSRSRGGKKIASIYTALYHQRMGDFGREAGKRGCDFRWKQRRGLSFSFKTEKRASSVSLDFSLK